MTRTVEMVLIVSRHPELLSDLHASSSGLAGRARSESPKALVLSRKGPRARTPWLNCELIELAIRRSGPGGI
jgi:hypothetical protein